MLKSLGIAGLVLASAISANASTLNVWTINADIQFFDDPANVQVPPPSNPVAGTLVGTFTFDKVADEAVSVDFEIAGLPGFLDRFNGVYNVVGESDRTVLQAGPATAAADFTDKDYVQLFFGEELTDFSIIGDTVDLTQNLGFAGGFVFFSSVDTCVTGSLDGCEFSSANIVFQGSATLTDVIPPIPLPATLPLLLAGFGTFAVAKRKKAQRCSNLV